MSNLLKRGLVVVLGALLALDAGARQRPVSPAPDTGAAIQSVDVANSTVTVLRGGVSRLYHVDPFADVLLDGAKATIRQLAPGMKVTSVSLSDPDTISGLEASDTVQAAAPVAAVHTFQSSEPPMSPAEAKAVTAKLAGTYWVAPGPISPASNWFYLSPTGRLVDAVHMRMLGT